VISLLDRSPSWSSQARSAGTGAAPGCLAMNSPSLSTIRVGTGRTANREALREGEGSIDVDRDKPDRTHPLGGRLLA
jgi:hypothetical protein